MYYNDGCGYCKKAKDLFKNSSVLDKITLLNTSTNNLPPGVNGVPHLLSRKNNTSSTGCPESIITLIEKLSVVKENFEDLSKDVKDLKILRFC